MVQYRYVQIIHKNHRFFTHYEQQYSTRVGFTLDNVTSIQTRFSSSWCHA